MTGIKINNQTRMEAIHEVALGPMMAPIQEKLVEYGKKDPRVCYVGADFNVKAFKELFPERAIDVGIAEQNQLCVATGLAKMGMIPVVMGFSPFIPMRSFDQLRTYLARHNSNVKIITTASGLVNCSHGTTHHDLESIALYRIVPNLIVLVAADNDRFERAFDTAMEHEGPVVIMGPAEIYAPGEDGPVTMSAAPNRFEIGKAEWMREGSDVCIISVGPALHYVLTAAEALEAQGVSTSVLNMCSIKPLDGEAIRLAAKKHKIILSVEEQLLNGGLGSAIAEVIAEDCLQIRFKRMGINDQFVEDLGDWTYTRQQIGLTSKGVAEQALNMLKNI